MKIVVEMTSEEFQEFLEWKKDKRLYAKEIEQADKELNLMAKQVLWAVEPDPKKNGKYKIVDHDHMADLFDAATEMIS